MGGGAGDTKTSAYSGLAASADGEWIYVTNMLDEQYRGSVHKATAAQFRDKHVVYRVRWSDKQAGKPFLGAGPAGSDEEHFNWPRGLAIDPDGNLYVCDHGNDRVTVFSPEGKLLGKIAVKDPHQVAVHPKTREIYILSTNDLKPAWGKRYGRLAKFSPFGDEACREIAAVSSSPHLPAREPERFRPARPFPWAMALDATARPTRLWVAMLDKRPYGAGHTRVKLVPVVDKGDAFEAGAELTDNKGLPVTMFLAADPARGRLLVRGRTCRYRAIDIASGAMSALPKSFADSYEIALDADGNIYRYGPWAANTVLRYDPEGRPLPFKATGRNSVSVPLYPRGVISGRGLCVAADGTLYAIANGVIRKRGCGQGLTRVMVYAPDGTLKNENLVPGLGQGDSCVGVGASGNVYLGINAKPPGEPYPAAFKPLLPGAEGRGPIKWWWWPDALRGASAGREPRPVPWCYSYYNPYLFHWGAVFKFGPEGGSLHGQIPPSWKTWPEVGSEWDITKAPASATSYRSGYLDREVRMAGAEWRYAGFGPCPDSTQRWGDPGCLCYDGRFAVDPYGRVFLPNPFRFCVETVDAAGNRLLRFGAYGNVDSAGPGSAVPEPAIAFGFPFAVARDEERVYVSDMINDRVAVLRMAHAAVGRCSIE
jgi:sugar lactone lactonase YvrE